MNFSIDNNLSWSKTLNSVENYIKTSNRNPKIFLSADIDGIDVNKTIDWLNDVYAFNISTKFFNENEIIALDILRIDELY